MNDLQTAVGKYLANRRALGARLREDGRLRQRFVEFLARNDAASLTTALALQRAN